MPATKPNPSKAESAELHKLNGKGPMFVRCELSKADKERLEHWASDLDDEDVWKWVYERVTGGHTVSLRCNDVGFQCSITGVYESSGHKDQCLVSRASTPLRALTSAMFKDVQVLAGAWPNTGRLDELDF